MTDLHAATADSPLIAKVRKLLAMAERTPNRMYFEETLAREAAAAARQHESFAVLFMDLNGFKHINDTHGHGAGDELIRQVGSRLAQTARRADFLARLGGDEFVVVARHTGEAEARRLAERLAAIVDKPFALASAEAHVTVSIGVALFPHDGSHSDELIKKADAAMYHAKRVTLRPVECHRASAPPPLGTGTPQRRQA